MSGRRATRTDRIRRQALTCFAAVIASLGVTATHLPATQAQPADDLVTLRDSERSALPSPPDQFLTEQRGPVRWVFPAAATSVVRGLQSGYAESWARVIGPLSGRLREALEIRVATNPEEMAELAPHDAPPPSYAVGVAYPAQDLVLLSLTAPETWEMPNVSKVLTHELSHIALHRATDGRSLPRWFDEGLAIHQAKENNIARMRTLWTGTLSGQLLPLRALSQAFPARPYDVNLAYAESADFVDFLLRQERGATRFRSLMQQLRKGTDFDEAILAAYYEHLPSMERRWRVQLRERFSTVPLLFSGTALWLLATLLLVLAYIRRRRDHRAAVERMAQEEEAQSRLFARVEQAANEKLGTDSDSVVYVPVASSELEVPTVEYRGQNYTLH